MGGGLLPGYVGLQLRTGRPKLTGGAGGLLYWCFFFVCFFQTDKCVLCCGVGLSDGRVSVCR